MKAAVQGGHADTQRAEQPQLNSAAAQYGDKVAICTVTPNGKQHTIVISQNAVASYLSDAPEGVSSALAAPSVREAQSRTSASGSPDGSFVAIWVRPSIVNDVL